MNNKGKENFLDALFAPRNVAIVEASDKLYYFIQGFMTHGFDQNKLYLVSQKEKELYGVKCYNSIDDIPDPAIDLVIIAVRREILETTLKEILGKKNVKFIHFFTAGTGESDEEGVKIERELKSILEKNGGKTRAIGPNCMGVYCPKGKNSYYPSFPLESGNLGLIFHSGDLHSKFITYGAIRYNLKISKGASVGNCVDLQISDFLKYYDRDDDTDFSCVYFEGFSKLNKSEGKRFLTTLRTIKKPVLFLQGGRSARAQTAVLSHTGSLSTNRKIWNAIFKQTPLIDAGTSLDDLIDCAYMFSEFFKKHRNIPQEKLIEFYPKTNNALVIIWSGGLGILDTDVLTEMGVNLPLFEGESKKKLMEVFPLKIGSLSNPLDLPWIVSTEVFVNICKAAVSDTIDLVVVESDSPLHWDIDRFERYYNNLLQIKKHLEPLNKVFVIIVPEYPHPIRQEFYQRLLKDGFVVYPSIQRAARAFLSLFEFGGKVRRFNGDLDDKIPFNYIKK